MRYAVIEVTVGGVELLVCNIDSSVVLKERRPLALASYIEKKRLDERGIQKLVDAIAQSKESCIQQSAEEIHAVALPGLASIKNIQQVIATIAESTGLIFSLISKATAVFCGVLAADEFVGQDVALLDIGSGSVHLAALQNPDEPILCYLNLNSLKLSNKLVRHTFPDKAETAEIKAHIKSKLKGDFFCKTYEKTVMIGNIAHSIARMYADYYNIKLATDLVLERKKLDALFDFLLTDPQKSALILKHAPERMETISCSVLIIKRILKKLGSNEILVRSYGIAEGYMQGLFRLLQAEKEAKEANSNPTASKAPKRTKKAVKTQAQDKKE